MRHLRPLPESGECPKVAVLGSTVRHHKSDDWHLLNDRFAPNETFAGPRMNGDSPFRNCLHQWLIALPVQKFARHRLLQYQDSGRYSPIWYDRVTVGRRGDSQSFYK